MMRLFRKKACSVNDGTEEKVEQLPPPWRLVTNILPTHDNKFEVKAELEWYRLDEYGGLYLEAAGRKKLEPFAGSAFLRRYNVLRENRPANHYTNLLAAESVESALIREFEKAVNVIERRRNLKPKVSTVPLPESSTAPLFAQNDPGFRGAVVFGNRTMVTREMLFDLGMTADQIAGMFVDDWRRSTAEAIQQLRGDHAALDAEEYGCE